jgi:uncharacterized protein YacL (UPF0231 family)
MSIVSELEEKQAKIDKLQNDARAMYDLTMKDIENLKRDFNGTPVYIDVEKHKVTSNQDGDYLRFNYDPYKKKFTLCDGSNLVFISQEDFEIIIGLYRSFLQ